MFSVFRYNLTLSFKLTDSNSVDIIFLDKTQQTWLIKCNWCHSIARQELSYRPEIWSFFNDQPHMNACTVVPMLAGFVISGQIHTIQWIVLDRRSARKKSVLRQFALFNFDIFVFHVFFSKAVKKNTLGFFFVVK